MPTHAPVLTGTHIRLEPLDYHHADGLIAASAIDPSLYRWTLVPHSKLEAVRYIDTALAGRDQGTAALAFHSVRAAKRPDEFHRQPGGIQFGADDESLGAAQRKSCQAQFVMTHQQRILDFVSHRARLIACDDFLRFV